MVTGASSGIGREVCIDLAEAGFRIVAAARRTDRLRSLCDEINGFGSESGSNKARAVPVELDAEECARHSLWYFSQNFCCGGVHAALDWPEEEWNSNIRTNLTGLWLVSKHVCRRMRDAKVEGSVINISSVTGLERAQGPGAIAYSASKTGVTAVTRVTVQTSP
ncbi:uncharacterized protein A4U43_C07F25400 [Asparagus officinalis]|uniref:Uncharacterized protein n=1 Tax=Asparagus officinalis TaxID=4686 RepID=A0A5P1EES5_ASPOF|nr:uncharacterized protein A4U43_C07F25400 [Asparagus officinalis]